MNSEFRSYSQVKNQSFMKWVLTALLVVAAMGSKNAMAASASASSSSSTNGDAGLSTGQSLSVKKVNAEPDITPILAFKHYNTTGRVRDFKDVYGFQTQLYTELQLGLMHKSGWGLYGQVVEYGKVYGDATKDTMSPSDPSVTLVHPAFTGSANFFLGGMIRQYFPVSDYMVQNSIYQTAYYLILNAKMKAGWEFFNILIPRYFNQPVYQDSSTVFYLEDRSTISKKLGDVVRIGLGQWTQFEFHAGTSMGNSIDIYPYIDIILGKNSLISPRAYFPIYTQGSVYDGPQSATFEDARAELFLQIAI